MHSQKPWNCYTYRRRATLAYLFRSVSRRFEMFCRKCGANMPEDSKFCLKCGAAVIVPSLSSASPTGTAAAVRPALEPTALATTSGQSSEILSSAASNPQPYKWGKFHKKTTWHEYGLSLFVVVSALSEFVRAMSNGDWAGMFGFMLVPLIFWAAFYWQHYWRKEPKPLNWADTGLGVLAWLGAIGIMTQHH